MTKLISSVLVAAALLSGTSSSMARPNDGDQTRAAYNSGWSDRSDRYGGHNPDSLEGNRAFWDYQTRAGGR